jgi:hypothetical protein
MTGNGTSRVATPGRPHAGFHPGFIWLALVTAIFAGFGFGGHLAFVIGFGLSLKASFPSMVQAHGHAQLVGWAGLFVIGTSLHFIPRLSSVPLPHQRWIAPILWLVGIGLLFRVFGQPALPYLGGGPVPDLLRWLVAGSGALEMAGILLYLFLLIQTLRGTGDISTQPAFGAVRPYFGMMAAGWLIYACVNFLLVVAMAWNGQAVLDQAWNDLAIRSFIGMAHSIRLFPMVLALSAAFWPVRGTAYAYLVGVGMELACTALSLLGVEFGILQTLGSLGDDPQRRCHLVVHLGTGPAHASPPGGTSGPVSAIRPRSPAHATRPSGLRGVWPIRASRVFCLHLARPGSRI